VDELQNDVSPYLGETGRIAGLVRGTFAGIDKSGAPLVEFAANAGEEPLPAVTTATLSRADIGCAVIIAFEDGDPMFPVILGVVRPLAIVESQPELAASAVVDGERIAFTASREIVLRCGDASLTLTRDGKVILRGNYVLSRANDVNRIKGGSVQIN
jgi:hypothetical protein